MPPIDRMEQRKPIIQEHAKCFVEARALAFLYAFTQALKIDPMVAVSEGQLLFTNSPWTDTALKKAPDFVGKFNVLIRLIGTNAEPRREVERMLGIFTAILGPKGTQHLPQHSVEFAAIRKHFGLESNEEAGDELQCFRLEVSNQLKGILNWNRLLCPSTNSKRADLHGSDQAVVWEAPD